MDDIAVGPGGQAGTARARTARRLTIAAIAALALLGVVPALASALPSWRSNGTPLSVATAIKWKGKVKMSDKVTGYGEVEIQCEATGTGYAGPSALGEVTTWTMSGCSNQGGSGCQSPTIEARRLPWHTELASVSGHVQNTIGAGGNTPGLKWKCLVGGVNFPDECDWVPPMTLTNVVAGVSAEFWKNGTCEYGSGHGNIEGSQTMEFKESGKGTLSAS
jgi:hypothetical protein